MDPATQQERRRHVRYPLGVAADVALPGGASRACRIRDICAGGLFLALEGGDDAPLDDGDLARDDRVVVNVKGEPNSLRESLSIAAPVARVQSTGVGLSFADLDLRSFDAVRRLVVLVREARARHSVAAEPGGSPASIKPPRVVVGDLMHTARRLLELARDADQSGVPRGDSGAAAPPAADPAARQAIVRALGALERSPEIVAANEDGSLLLHQRLEAVWRERGPPVGEADATVIEIVSRMLDAILRDALVSAEVKRWIRRLAIPVLKVALQDGFFFFANEHHPARVVLNRLGEIEPPGGDAVGWWSRIDELVERAVSESDRGGSADGFELRQSVFSEVLSELDAVIEEQRERYAANVTRLVRERVMQQALLRARRATASREPGAPPEPAAQSAPSELERWLERVERLRSGDVLYAKSHDGRTRRLKLAHVGEDRDSLLFVDPAGNKAGTFTHQALAMQFRHGDVRVLDPASLPIVERGICAMLNDLHHRLAWRVMRDELTGLLNRRGLEVRIEEALARSVTMGSSAALALVEIDAIPAVVEKCGAETAGALLKRFSPVIEERVRGKGVAARVRGGCFAALFDDCTLDAARAATEGLRELAAGSRCTWHGDSFALTVSAGLTAVEGTSGSVATICDAADAALSSARRLGGNRVEIHETEPGGTGSAVDGALERANLQLRCQRVAPIGADTGTAPHFEVLLGVRDIAGGIAEPGAFIRAAERGNRMQEVDRWVVRTLCEWMSRNRAAVDRVDGYSINLSSVSLADLSFTDYVIKCLGEMRIPATKLVFEVADGAAIDTTPGAVDFIQALRDHGCRFSLDRFGAGETSLVHLETLPIDYVKIDGALIKAIASSPHDFAVVQSLNEITHYLGRKTVAGCVENDGVLARLRGIGVDYAQGFRIERPFVLHEPEFERA